jgi:hypothetical protein
MRSIITSDVWRVMQRSSTGLVHRLTRSSNATLTGAISSEVWLEVHVVQKRQAVLRQNRGELVENR